MSNNQTCPDCGHSGFLVNGICNASVPVCSDEYHGTRSCRHQCVLPEPAEQVTELSPKPPFRVLKVQYPSFTSACILDATGDAFLWVDHRSHRMVDDICNFLNTRAVATAPAAGGDLIRKMVPEITPQDDAENAIQDLFHLLERDTRGRWCFKSLSTDAAEFDRIMSRLEGQRQ